MEDSIRQMIGACYIALAEAAGPGVLEHANKTLDDAVKSGAVSDPVAQRAILILTRSCKAEAVAADMNQAVAALDAATGSNELGHLMAPISEDIAALAYASPADIRALIAKVELLEEAITRRQPADAVA